MEENKQISVTKSTELLEKEQLALTQFNLSPIGQMVKQFEAQQRIAQMFAKSQIVPQAYRNNVADCCIAIDMAMRMNCNPLTVMQNLVIVQGRPTWQSQFLIACINQSGRFTTMQFEQKKDGMVGKLEYDDNEWDNVNRCNRLVKRTFDGTSVPNLSCRAYATDKHTGEVVYGTTIDVRMAVKERWYTKSGSKWQTMPKQMLIYRAAAFFQRAYCPEISMGFSTTDEIQDIEVISTASATQSTARKSLAEIAAEAAETITDAANGPAKQIDTSEQDNAQPIVAPTDENKEETPDVVQKKTLL